MVTAPSYYDRGIEEYDRLLSSVPYGLPIPRNITEIFLFVAPFMMFLRMNGLGTLFATDFLLLLVFPFVLVTGIRHLRKRQIWLPLLLCFFWLLSQIVTDVIVHSSPDDFIRGWSKIFLTLAYLATFWILIGSSMRRFVFYGLGWSTGAILGTIVAPSEQEVDTPWKFGSAIPTTLLVLILASLLARGRHRWIFPASMICMAMINLFSSARSLGLICVLVGAYSYFLMRLNASGRRLGGMKKSVVWAMVLAAALGFYGFYKYSAQSGLLGRKDQEKYQQQSGQGNVVLGGRHEILASLQAVRDSPIIGHGSWARDETYYQLMVQKVIESGGRMGGGKKGDKLQEHLIPEHSFVMGAWVEAGLAGAVFWFYVLFQIIRALRRATGGEPFLPVFAFMGILSLWNIPFSPYSAEQRFASTYFFIAMLMLSNMTEALRARRLAGSR